jgi:hypothetical protein
VSFPRSHTEYHVLHPRCHRTHIFLASSIRSNGLKQYEASNSFEDWSKLMAAAGFVSVTPDICKNLGPGVAGEVDAIWERSDLTLQVTSGPVASHGPNA